MAFAPTETQPGSTQATQKYVLPLILVTSLFFLWGLANILNSALIAQFQPLFEISRAQALLVETAFYFGYFTVALPAALFMERTNYKKGIIVGLLLYAVGALMFIPAASLMTFGFFLIALYIIASGLAFLETAANPYVTMLGKPETSVQRLNFSQSFNGVALIVGPWMAGQFIFAGNEGAMTSVVEKQQAADAVILPYSIIAGGVLVIALLVSLTRMPEFSSAKLTFDRKVFRHKHLVRATIAQFFYVGAQAGIWGITINFIIELLPGTSKELASKNYMAIGTLLFVVGRFFGTWLMTVMKDHRLLTLYGGAATLLSLVAVFAEGATAVYAVLAINFFMSIMFPTIFALGVKGIGHHMKLGSSLIIMAIVGGAIVPPLMGLIADTAGIQLSFLLPAACFLVVLVYGQWGSQADSLPQS